MTQSTHVLDPSSLILITGGTGFVGSHLVEYLLAQGYQNIVVTNYSPDAGYVGTLLPKRQIVAVDLTDREATFDLIRTLQPQVIFHLASIAVVGDSFEKAARIFQNNISLQLNILEAVRIHSASTRIIVVGSGTEYGMVGQGKGEKEKDSNEQLTISEDFLLNPTNPYAVSKVTQDLLGLSYFYSYHLDIVRVRPFNHIGERQTLDFAIPSFAHQIAAIEHGQQDVIKVGNLEAVRDFSDVKDVVRAYLVLAQHGKSGEVYNIGSGKGYTMRQILDTMCALSTQSIRVEVDPARLRPQEVAVAVADIRKMKKLGWEPEIELKETLQRVLDEWRKRK